MCIESEYYYEMSSKVCRCVGVSHQNGTTLHAIRLIWSPIQCSGWVQLLVFVSSNEKAIDILSENLKM